jgi:hypothetical protein
VTDLNGDGYRDLVFYRPATGEISPWLMGWQNGLIQRIGFGLTPEQYRWIQDLTWRLVGAK